MEDKDIEFIRFAESTPGDSEIPQEEINNIIEYIEQLFIEAISLDRSLIIKSNHNTNE